MIVILEDDNSIRELVLYTLKNSNLSAKGYSNSLDFYNSLENEIPSLLLLDIMLPNEDGLEVLKKIREHKKLNKLPVIMLTAKDSEYDKILGLDLGADDYVTKPFSMLELVSRIKALLRRTNDNDKVNVLEYKKLKLEIDTHTVYLNNHKIDLTLKEYNTLKLLLTKLNKVITREELLNVVWGYEYEGETRTVDVHIRTIRAKFKEYENYIQTVRGVGYRIGGLDD